MKLSPSIRIFALILVAVIASSCASYTAQTAPGPQRSPLETAKLAYSAGALDYDFSLKIVKELRGFRLVDDAQWKRVENVGKVLAEWAPLVHDMLTAWEELGVKPANFESAMARVSSAHLEMAAVKSEVQH